MRGLSFSSSASRFDKFNPNGVPSSPPATQMKSSSPSPFLSQQPNPTSTAPPAEMQSTAAKMMKKLSTTFRRKTSFNPNSFPNPDKPVVPAATPSPPLSSLSSSISSDRSIRTNNNVTSPRAMTFTARATSNKNSSPTSDIPFFGDRSQQQQQHQQYQHALPLHASVAKVSGSPHEPQIHPYQYHDADETWASDSRLSLPTSPILTPSVTFTTPAPQPRQQPQQQQQLNNVLRESTGRNIIQEKANRKPPRTPYHRYFSFDMSSTLHENNSKHQHQHQHQHQQPKHYHYSSNDKAQWQQQQQHTGEQEQWQRQRQGGRGRRRWYLPLSESPDKPRLFTPTVESFALISQPRDQAEATTLASVSTFLQAEIDRLSGHIHTHSQGNSSACGGGEQNQDCCVLAEYLPVAVSRLDMLLRMLEERYNSVEEFYVKRGELSKAMGNLLSVSTTPAPATLRDVGDHDNHGDHQQQQRARRHHRQDGQFR